MSIKAITLSPLPIAEVIERYLFQRPDIEERIRVQIKRFANLGVPLERSKWTPEIDLDPESDWRNKKSGFFSIDSKVEHQGHFTPALQIFNSLLYGHITREFENLRRGNWIAEGVDEPADKKLTVAEIVPGRWKRPASFLSIKRGVLYEEKLLPAADRATIRALKKRRGPGFHSESYEKVNLFSDIHVGDAQPQRRLTEQDAPIGCAIGSLADPPDRPLIQNYLENPTGPHALAIKRLTALLRVLILNLLAEGAWELRSPDDIETHFLDLTPEVLKIIHLDPFGSTARLEKKAPHRALLRRTEADSFARKNSERGRPSRSQETNIAFTDLMHEGLLDLEAPKSKIYAQVRQRIFDYAGTRDRTGIGDDALRKQLSTRIDIDRPSPPDTDKL
jgi:hypothetical protein